MVAFDSLCTVIDQKVQNVHVEVLPGRITSNIELLMQMNCNIHIYILMVISICDKEPISWLKYHRFKV